MRVTDLMYDIDYCDVDESPLNYCVRIGDEPIGFFFFDPADVPTAAEVCSVVGNCDTDRVDDMVAALREAGYKAQGGDFACYATLA